MSLCKIYASAIILLIRKGKLSQALFILHYVSKVMTDKEVSLREIDKVGDLFKELEYPQRGTISPLVKELLH